MRPSLPSIVLAAASKFTYSLCVAVYAEVLSSLGLGFVSTGRGLAVLTLLLLMVGLASLDLPSSVTRQVLVS